MNRSSCNERGKIRAKVAETRTGSNDLSVWLYGNGIVETCMRSRHCAVCVKVVSGEPFTL